MNEIGKIVEIRRGEDSVRVEWQIPEFLSLGEKAMDFIRSPSFNFSQSECFLHAFPFGEKDSEGRIGIYLQSASLYLYKHLTYTLGIRQANCIIDETSKHIGKCPPFQWFFVRGRETLLTRAELLKRSELLLPSGVLNISCTMQSDGGLSSGGKTSEEPEVECVWDTRFAKAKEPVVICLSSDSSDSDEEFKTKGKAHLSRETQTEDIPDDGKKDVERERLERESISNLRSHLRDLMLHGQDYDVTIKVRDREYKAHKDLLRARSPVFAAMFKHNMEENSSGTVSIDDCDPDAFREFLSYVYTGEAEIDSAKTALDLYYVGDKYDFSLLKETCVRHLMDSLTATVICDVIKMAKTHSEADLMQCAVSFFSENLEEILVTVEWQRFLQSNSVVANELYIKAVKNLLPNKKKKIVSPSSKRWMRHT